MKQLWAVIADPVRDLWGRNDRFTRGILAILTGTVLSKVIVFAAIPLLSRLFSPSEFGVFALFGMVTATLGPLVTWRYEAAIVLPEEDDKAVNLLGVCIGLATISSLLIALIFFFFAESVAGFFGAPKLKLWLYWSPLCIWATGIFTALRLWSSRTDDFRSISIARVSDTTALVLTQVGLGFLFRGMLFGLMLGPIVARLTGAGVLLWQTLRSDAGLIRKSLSPRIAVEQAKRYLRFPLYDLPATTLSSISREMPPGVLGIFFITQWVGLYSIACRILSVPLQMLGGAIAQVYLPVAQDAQQAGRLDRFTLSIFNRLMGIAITPMIIVAIAAPELIVVILGEEWFAAGQVLRWLTPAFLMGFIASPLSEIYSVLERQTEKLVFNVATVLVRLFSLLIGGLLGDAILAIALFGVSGTVFWILQCFWLLRLSRIKTGMIIKNVMVELLRALPFIIFIGTIQYFYSSPKKVVLAVFVALCIFAAWRWKEFLGPGSTSLKISPS